MLVTLLLHFEIPKDSIDQMVCIAHAESNLKPKAVNRTLNRNGTIDYGLFQINSIWLKTCKLTEKSILEPRNNIKCAALVYKKQGITAWATARKCEA